MRDQRGFALIAVLLVMTLVGLLAAEFAYSMRLEATSVRAYKDGLTGAHLAEAAVEQAIREIAGDVAFAAVADDGLLTFYNRERAQLRRLPRANVPLGAGRFSYRITDEEARLNLNTSPPDRVDRLLLALGVEKVDRDVINDSLQDWRDPNDEHRLNGAESEDTYLKLPVPYRAKNAAFDSVAELQQVKGITPALLAGADRRPGLTTLVTVKTPGQVNVNTADCLVLRALSVSDAECESIRQTRRDTPYTAVPGPLGGRGLSVTTRTYRIEAEGSIDGRVAARLTAIVQRRAEGNADGVAILEWSGVR